jgi:hypothetical protein
MEYSEQLRRIPQTNPQSLDGARTIRFRGFDVIAVTERRWINVRGTSLNM